MKLLEIMMVDEATESLYGVYNGIGQSGVDYKKICRLEVKIGDDLYYLPISGTIKRKDFPELQSLFNSEFYGDKKEVTDKKTIDKILKHLS